MIKEANDTALTASANAGMAEGDANMSLDIAQKANATTHAAKKVFLQIYCKKPINALSN